MLKIDAIIWESAEESVQITDSLLQSWSGRYTPAAKKFFDLCKGENESIRKNELSQCGAKVLEDFKVDQSQFFMPKKNHKNFAETSLMTDFLQFSFDKFDEDGNNELSFDEFEKIFANFIATSGSTMIKLFDKNGNGLLDKAEIVQVKFFIF